MKISKRKAKTQERELASKKTKNDNGKNKSPNVRSCKPLFAVPSLSSEIIHSIASHRSVMDRVVAHPNKGMQCPRFFSVIHFAMGLATPRSTLYLFNPEALQDKTTLKKS